LLAAPNRDNAFNDRTFVSGDYRVGSAKTRCQANEVAIGMVLPSSAIEAGIDGLPAEFGSGS